jgi:hypothetical protein
MPRGCLDCRKASRNCSSPQPFVHWAVKELGSVQAIGKSVIRGEKLAKAKKYSLTGK